MLRTRPSHPLWLTCLLSAALLACDDEGGSPAQSADDQGAAAMDAGLDMALADMAQADMAQPDLAAPDMAPPAPGEPGPHAVGFHVETIEYMAPGQAEPRPLELHWWYPTAATEGGRVRYGNLLTRPEVFGDAPPLPELADAPVLVFSHGNGGFGEQSFFFTEFMASHGWVVVAPDHTGNTFNDALRDSLVPIWLMFELRPTDIRALLDHVDALPGEHPLADLLHPTQRALAGHSFGGYTSMAVGGSGYDVDRLLAACQDPPEDQVAACEYTVGAADRYRAGFTDDRLQAIVPMTPAGNTLFGGDPGIAGIQIPTLMLTAGRDATLPNPAEGDPLWAGITQADSLRVDFPNAGHYTFSDACTLPVPVGEDDGCNDTFLPVADAHPLINALSLAFLKLHVLGDGSDAEILAPDSDFGGADIVRSVVGE